MNKRLGEFHIQSGRKKIILALPGFVPRTFQSAACKESTTQFYRSENEVNGAWDSDSRHNAVGMETANIDSYVTVSPFFCRRAKAQHRVLARNKGRTAACLA